MLVETIFTSPKKWNPLSFAIKMIEGVDFSHVALVYPSVDFGRPMVVQAKLFNTHSMPIHEFLKTSHVVNSFSFELTEEQFKSGMDQIAPEMGGPYAYLQLFLFLFRKYLKINFWFEAKGNYCTEIWAKFAFGSGAVSNPGRDTCDIGLVDAFKLCKRAKGVN